MDSLGTKPEITAPLEERGERRHLMEAPLREALAGAVFPLNRDQLVEVAKENDAARTVLSLLAGLPSGRYGSLAEIELAFDAQSRAGAR